MTWETNSITYVKCDDARHVGSPVSMVETGFDATAGQALAKQGWTYNHAKHFHRCPQCTALRQRLN